MLRRRLPCALGLLALFALLPAASAPAAAPPLIPPNSSVGTGGAPNGTLKWNEGTPADGVTFDCLIQPGSVTPLGAAWLSYWGAQGVSPQVGQIFYVKASWMVTGFPCGTGSAYVAPEFALPRATQLAISNDTPVRCFVKLQPNRAWQEFSRAECPQAPGQGQGGGLSFNPTDRTGAWPTASGTAYELWIPVVATQPLGGDTQVGAGEGCPNCLWGGFWFIDGVEDPWMLPKLFIYTGPGGTPTGSATAPRIQYPVPSTYVSNKAFEHDAAQQDQYCKPANSGFSSTWITGEVYTKSTNGAAYFEIGPGHTGPYQFTKTGGAPTDPAVPAGDWRYDLCVLALNGSGGALPPGDYHYRFCFDPANSATDVCGPDQDFAVAGAPDSTPPDTSIVDKPAAITDGSADRFTFRSTEVGSTFLCSLDGAAFKACLVATYENLAVGDHMLSVKAKDRAGNVDPTPATHRWQVQRGGTPAPNPTPTPAPTPTPTPTPAPAAKCVVPKLKGKTLRQVRTTLRRAKCRLGKVTRKRSRAGRRGRVIAQRPAPGRRLARNAKVAVVLKK